jgi:multicomponent Na+:H+ antiporter subunit D
MPVTALVFWIAALSISGVPLFNGFVSKGMVLMAAEQTNFWLWVLLEIASFGTVVSFLKLGYFAFLRPGNTEASDPPLLMQIAMIGTATLCILIGVYPGLLYGLLPYPVTYQAFDMAQLAVAALVLGAAAVFFFTVGKKVLVPHETRLRDFDVLYVAAGRSVTVFAEGLQKSFRRVYGCAAVSVKGLLDVGRYPVQMLDWDINWDLAVLALGGFCVLFALIVENRVIFI